MFLFILTGAYHHIQPLTVSANPYSSCFQLPSSYEDHLLHPKPKNTLLLWWVKCKLTATAIGCCPSEAEIQEILVAAEDEETSGSVKLDRFLSTVSHIIQEKRSVFKLMPVKPPPLRGWEDSYIYKIGCLVIELNTSHARLTNHHF